VEIILILPLIQLRIKIGVLSVLPLDHLRNYGKPSLQILLTGGITGEIRLDVRSFCFCQRRGIAVELDASIDR
jgi:hypothetical protein